MHTLRRQGYQAGEDFFILRANQNHRSSGLKMKKCTAISTSPRLKTGPKVIETGNWRAARTKMGRYSPRTMQITVFGAKKGQCEYGTKFDRAWGCKKTRIRLTSMAILQQSGLQGRSHGRQDLDPAPVLVSSDFDIDKIDKRVQTALLQVSRCPSRILKPFVLTDTQPCQKYMDFKLYESIV
jgi:hypothetical protein